MRRRCNYARGVDAPAAIFGRLWRRPWRDMRPACMVSAMSDDSTDSTPTALRFRADACRSLAETSDGAERKAIWLQRAQYWEDLSLKAAERLLEAVKSQKT